ncbi:ABC transporter permease [Streptomyces decoyicus]|uniref:ABC transporter permease n=1 Tax=Streptomyces decoyicus TaxID=249567 RepID=A0ABZ1FAI4_9ACTN|nr:ABC transporter permease [Streptomyces decoyicus]WSB67344.1 ABC transporter permease [Streptomyces decoyicus]
MFLTAARMEQRAMQRNPLLLVNSGMLPAAFLVTAVETGRPDPDDAAALVVAVALTALWGSTVWMSGGVLRRERTYGTLARCVSGVWSPYLVLLGKSLGATVTSVGAILVSTGVTAVALGLPLSVSHPGWIVVSLVVLVCSGTALGALVSCLFLVTRNGLIWSHALMYPVFALGGLLIPVDALPESLRWVPDLISLHWIKDCMVGAVTGDVTIAPLGVATLLTLVYLSVAGLAYRRSVEWSRKEGTLDLA